MYSPGTGERRQASRCTSRVHKDGTRAAKLRPVFLQGVIFSTDADLRRSTRMTALRSNRSVISKPSWLHDASGRQPSADRQCHDSDGNEEARRELLLLNAAPAPSKYSEQRSSPKPEHSSLLIRERQGQFRAPNERNRHLVPQRKE